MQNKKTILLGISINHGISRLIEANLKYHSFEVILISPHIEKGDKFKYPSLCSYLKVKYQKIILKDKQAKIKLQSQILKNQLTEKIQQKEIDYALFFLAQNFSQELIKFVRSKVKKGGMVNYQWDGVKRYPRIYERLPLFDRAFVFDPIDLSDENYTFLPTTSFYFDHDLIPLPLEYDFYFLGSHIPNRCETIIQFAKFAQEKNLSLNFQIFCGNELEKIRKLYPNNVLCIGQDQIRTYEENLLNSRKSKVLLDFVISEHKGLSLRTFEALGHNKKLITTNKEIKKYDFYHPHNIFVLEDNFDEIEAFLAKPYFHIDENIKQKYSFGNWIRYVLDIPPYQPILLPKGE